MNEKALNTGDLEGIDYKNAAKTREQFLASFRERFGNMGDGLVDALEEATKIGDFSKVDRLIQALSDEVEKMKDEYVDHWQFIPKSFDPEKSESGGGIIRGIIRKLLS